MPPLFEDLDFNGPLSSARADQLLTTLGPLEGRRVVDLGCGWGELLLRAVARGAVGHGVDLDAAAIEHGRATAEARGLAVTLEVGDAGAWTGSADVVIVNGATHVWGGDPVDHTANALRAVHELLRPGGRLLLGEGFWQVPPSAERLAVMPMVREEYRSMAELVDLALDHGYQLLHLSQATLDEWDDFESRHALGRQRWLQANPDATDVAARAAAHRTAWLRGWREVLGMAYLTLLKP
ncbi:SAM-dependent methyltransferase [Actinokineospora fastidiosa]|nr:class I SAM-dependent methyltransferase [Actinokineospora fastidiosa]